MNMKTRAEIGVLESVEITEMWRLETAFSDWLAEPDNLELFGEKIGLKLAESEREVGVGKFFADIHCRDVENDCVAVIENQFGQTNHDHLGKLLTYATGLDAVTVVWIAEDFRFEHRQSMDWLNEISRPDIHFFGVEIKLRKIGDSAIAPDFVVVSEPNDWARTMRTVANLSKKDRAQYEYWTAFQDFCRSRQRFKLFPFPKTATQATKTTGETSTSGWLTASRAYEKPSILSSKKSPTHNDRHAKHQTQSTESDLSAVARPVLWRESRIPSENRRRRCQPRLRQDARRVYCAVECERENQPFYPADIQGKRHGMDAGQCQNRGRGAAASRVRRFSRFGFFGPRSKRAQPPRRPFRPYRCARCRKSCDWRAGAAP